MAELRKCSRCRSDIELKYFGINRKGEPSKTCDTCITKKKQLKVKQEEHDTASTRTPDTIEDDKYIYIYIYIIVMDVETNGFIKTRNAQPASNNISQFPHIVQFSWVL